MDAVTILREIWRCRLVVGVAAVVAILVGLAITYTVSLPPKDRKHEVAIASSRILIDTPNSQVVTVEPRGLETLGARASVLANVMTEGEIKTIIAGAAGLHPNELHAGVVSEGVLPADLSAAAANPAAYLMTAHTETDADNVPLPIIEIEAQAPDSAAAVRLGEAAITGLQGFLASKAANENVPDARRLRVTGLGSPQVRQDIRGPKRMVALVVAVFLFLCACVGILVLSTLAPGWRVSTLAPGWLPKLVPGRGRADAASKPTDDAGSALWLPTLDPGRASADAPSKPTNDAGSHRPLWLPKLVPGRGRADAASKPTNGAGSRRALPWRPKMVPGRGGADAASKPTDDAGSRGTAKPNRRPASAPE